MAVSSTYWAMIDGRRIGPMTVEMLVANGLEPQTPVWTAGMTQWVPASWIPEILWVFDSPAYQWRHQNGAMPPYPNGQAFGYANRQMMPPCPNTYLAFSILVTVLCCIAFGIPAIIYSTNVTTKYNQGDYEGAKSASDKACMWCIIALIAGLVWIPIGIFL